MPHSKSGGRLFVWDFQLHTQGWLTTG